MSGLVIITRSSGSWQWQTLAPAAEVDETAIRRDTEELGWHCAIEPYDPDDD